MKKTFIVLIFILLAGLTSCVKEEPKLSLIDNVNQVIDAFIDNYANKYFIESDGVLEIDYHVASALGALFESGYQGSLDTYLFKEVVQAYYDNIDYQTPNDCFKAIVIGRAFGFEASSAKAKLATIDDVDKWSVANTLIALNITNNNNALKEKLINQIGVINEEDYRDADYAGEALIATYNLDIDKSALHALIDESLTKDGVSSAWGGANACSTSYVILGLVASNLDPTSPKYTTEDINLIEALLKYEEGGAFKFQLDGDIDLGFSTPQAFSALVAYKLYCKDKKPIIIFK